MAKLYQCTLILMAMGEDEEAARDALVEDAYLDPELAYTASFAEARSVPAEWYDALPYGENNDRTCGQIIQELHDDPD